MEQELKPASIRLRFAALRSLYTYLMLREGLAVNPLAEVTLPRARHSLPVHLSLRQMEDLLSLPLRTPVDKKSPDWLPYRDAAILELFYSCGIRLSELVGLNADALLPGDNCVRVLGKGRKERLVPVGEYAMEAILNYRMRAGLEPHGPLFISRLRRRMTGRSVQLMLDKYLRCSDLPFHISPPQAAPYVCYAYARCRRRPARRAGAARPCLPLNHSDLYPRHQNTHETGLPRRSPSRPGR